jgi:hypothetical protein
MLIYNFCFQKYFDCFTVLLKYEKTYLSLINLIMINVLCKKTSLPSIVNLMIFDGDGEIVII